MLAIIDYGAGNLQSVSNVLSHLGFQHRISSDYSEIMDSERVLFPGVGAAESSMLELRQRGLDQALRDFAASGKPMMGICVGCQVLLDSSEEDGGIQTLGLVSGRARRFVKEEQIKIPHMGWNQVHQTRPHVLFDGIASGVEFYYVHSFYPQLLNSSEVLAKTTYGSQEFDAALLKDNIFATQFHAEKSGEVGLRLISNFCRWDGKDSLC